MIKKKNFKNRAIEIDILRGIAVLFMIFDHFMYDCAALMQEIFVDYGMEGWTFDLNYFAISYWNWDVRFWFRQIILIVFMGLIGICCTFSKNNLKRGIKLFLVGLLGTYIFGLITKDLDITIVLGVLQIISLSLILIGILDIILKNKKWDKYVFLVLGIVMLALGIYFYKDCERVSYSSENFFILLLEMLIGKKGAGSDYFPFLIYGGEIFIGVFIGKIFYKNKKSLFNLNYHNNPLTFIGRNSLIIYFAHQIIIPLVLGIILLICGFTLNI